VISYSVQCCYAVHWTDNDDDDDDDDIPAKIKAMSPNRQLQQQQQTTHAKTICLTNDCPFCAITGCRGDKRNLSMTTRVLAPSNAQNPLHQFPSNFPVDGEAANLLRTCCRLVSDTANNLNMSPTSPQQVRNNLATSLLCRRNGIWETTRHNRHNGLLPAPTCYV